MAYWTN